MAIRATQQYVDVFGTVNGAVRVSRQFVEVLHEAGSADVPASADNTLAFVSTGHGILEEQEASSNLGISDVAAAILNLNVSASSTINFTQAVLKTASESVTSNLALVHTYFDFNYVADRQVPENTLSLVQTASVGGFETVEHDLGLSDAVDVRGPIPLLATAQLTFSDVIRNTCHNMHVDQDLGLTDEARYPLPTQNVTDTLNLVDLAYMSFIDDVISFTQVAVGGKSPGVQHQTITFTQTLLQGGTFRRTITQDLGISQSLTYFDDTPCNRKNYAPFMGEGSEMPDSITDPQFDTSPGDSDRFLIYWPARGGRSTTISIRAPQFGNRDRNAYTRVNRETRGGLLVVYADPTWPQVRTMAVTIIGLTKTEVDEIQDLFYDHLGQLIGITDWEGYEWEGIVIDPEQPAVHDGKRGWTITFQFEGSIIDGYSPGHLLSVDDTAGDAKDPGANSPLSLAQELGGSWPTPDAPPGQGLGFISSASATVVSP